jgi:5-methylcytosine-specific restriction endonuclease McrA
MHFSQSDLCTNMSYIPPFPESSEEDAKPVKRRKETIPRALREQVWIHTAGRRFEVKCPVQWCKNTINVFDFHVGHNIPESKGGTLALQNLKPICSRCNLSMSSNYTIESWNELVIPASHATGCWFWRRFKANKVFPT